MSEPTYTISADGKSITCGRCHITSYHPMDIFHKYCAACRVFHEVSIAHDTRSADSLLHEVARLQAENAALFAALEPVERHRKIGEVWVELSPREWDDVRRLLKAEHGGAALLAELTAARAVVAAARVYCSRSTSFLPIEKRDTDALGVLIEALALYDEAVKARTK